MRACSKYLFLLLVASISLSSCKSQPSFGTEYLRLIKTIPLPGVKGRIDHLDVNLKDQTVYIAALGNNTLEVIDVVHGTVVRSIKGLDEPQGVGYIPQHQEVFVANGGDGACYFFDAKTLEKKATIKLDSDADDVRYDSVDQKIYVGYGTGGIAVIDADTHQEIGNIKMPVHPEGFQLDRVRNAVYVNLPDAQMIGVADLKQMKLVNQWRTKALSANFPMALDTLKHRVFVGFRHPPKLVVLDAQNGNIVRTTGIVGDTDDLYYDAADHRVYISGGDGTVSIFQEEGTGFKQIANLPTRTGARTSLLIPSLHLYVVAARAASGKEAQLLVYKTK